MKQLISVLAVLVGVQAMAASNNNIQANHFVCKGEQNTQVSYDATSITGKPLMHVTFRGEEARLNSAAITRTVTNIGTLVQGVDNHMVPLDGPTVRYNLVLPIVVLGSNGAAEKFETILVQTSVANPFFGPRPFTGTVEHNEFVTVECTAEQVIS